MTCRKIILIAISVLSLSLCLNAKEPPADLGYDPPAGWEFVMKLDSLSSFNIHCHNDTCIIATSSYSNSKEIKYLITTNGGDTWENFVDMGNWKFKINSNVLHHTKRQDNKSYYEISYDLLKTTEEYAMVNLVNKDTDILESPIDTNLLIYSLWIKYINTQPHHEDYYIAINQISRDAGRNWEMLNLYKFPSGYTVHSFNFDWSEKGRFLYKVEDGYGYGLIPPSRKPKYFETSDYGLTSQEIKFDPTDNIKYSTLDKIRLPGIDGPRTIREIPRFSENEISISHYDDTLKNTQLFDWLYIMDPSKPKSNQDSGYMRGFFYLDYHFDYLNYKNIVLRVVEFIDTSKSGKVKRYHSIYTSLNNGFNWILLNDLGTIPNYMNSYLDQGTKTLWIHVKDEETQIGKNDHSYKGSLWKLKLPWESTSVKEVSDNKSGMVIYPNPANNSVSIRFNLHLSGLTKIVIYDNSGREVKRVLLEHLEAGEQNVNTDIYGLKSGNYFIKVSSPGTEISFKLIINR